MIIGVDPGTLSSAAVAVKNGRVVDWLVMWRGSSRAKWNVEACHLGPAFRTTRSQSSIVQWWGSSPLDHLVVEGLFQSKRSNLLKLAESAGVWLGQLEPHAGKVHRPRANGSTKERAKAGWRQRVLHLPADMDAFTAERAAVELVHHLYEWAPPEDLPPKARGALAEACCMTAWASGAEVPVDEVRAWERGVEKERAAEKLRQIEEVMGGL